MAEQQLPYDYEDFGLTPSELDLKYHSEGVHPEYSNIHWAISKSKLDYWDWVALRISEDDEAY